MPNLQDGETGLPRPSPVWISIEFVNCEKGFSRLPRRALERLDGRRVETEGSGQMDNYASYRDQHPSS